MQNLFPAEAKKVSIHAPGRGATCRQESPCTRRCRFNSRTREGCDLRGSRGLVVVSSFNSRTREGCDRTLMSCLIVTASFNSRTREGCDK